MCLKKKKYFKFIRKMSKSKFLSDGIRENVNANKMLPQKDLKKKDRNVFTYMESTCKKFVFSCLAF
jgi:hypothetical protein